LLTYDDDAHPDHRRLDEGDERIGEIGSIYMARVWVSLLALESESSRSR